MSRLRDLRLLVATLLLVLLLAACGGGAETVAPGNPGNDGGDLLAPTEPPPPAISIIDATATAGPGATPTAPNPGDAGQPVDVTAPVVGPETFPAGVNPLTGLPVADPAVLDRRPLVIKVSNFPRYVRPQYGLSFADQVWEHYAEGGTTRFSAIFLSQTPQQVGPLRSARLIDTIIPEMLDAGLVTSGGSTGTMYRLRLKPWAALIISDVTGYGSCPPLCRESDDTNALFTNAADIWAIESTLTGAPAAGPLRGLAFSPAAPTGGAAGNLLRIDYSGEANTEWRYDPATGLYLRFSDVAPGTVEPHYDALSNTQITASNVVVLWVNHVVDRTIPEDYDDGGISGHFATEIQLWGTGQAQIFRDGQMIDATWVRLDDGMVGLVDGANQPILLKPGVTWFQPVGLYSEYTAGAGEYYIRHVSPVDRGNLIGVEDFLTQTAEAPPPTPTVEGEGGEGTPTPTP